MIDNEIIKALECCSINGCKNCKYKGKAPDCMTALQKDTIDLINRQKAEILELQKRIINWRADMDYRPDEIKSEAIKEFAERLKATSTVVHKSYSGIHYYDTDDDEIDKLVKEMTELQTNQRKEDEGK